VYAHRSARGRDVHDEQADGDRPRELDVQDLYDGERADRRSVLVDVHGNERADRANDPADAHTVVARGLRVRFGSWRLPTAPNRPPFGWQNSSPRFRSASTSVSANRWNTYYGNRSSRCSSPSASASTTNNVRSCTTPRCSSTSAVTRTRTSKRSGSATTSP